MIADIRSILEIGVKRRVMTTGRQPGDPTPEEIVAACEAIRSEWSELTRSGRKAKIAPVDMGVIHRVMGE